MASSPNHPDLEQVVRDGLSSLVLAFGYKTGIVDALADNQPCTAEELNEKAGKKLRYTQEWLGCMVAAGIVCIAEDGKYSLPYERHVLDSWGQYSTVIPIFSEAFPQLEQVTSSNGPNGYGYQTSFLEWLDEARTPKALENWIKQNIEPLLKLKSENTGKNFAILDLGCGFGKQSKELAKRYPNSSISATDTDKECIDHANKERSENGPKNINFFYTPDGKLPDYWKETFDFIIMNDVLHDSSDVDAILTETKRVLKSDGFAAAYDPPVSSYHNKVINNRMAQYYLPFSLFSCLPVSSLASPRDKGLGIGWGYERRKQKIAESGFDVVKVKLSVETIQEGIVFKKK